MELVIVMFLIKLILDFLDGFEIFRVILIIDKENIMSIREVLILLVNDVKYCWLIIEKYGKELMENYLNILMIIFIVYRIK